MNKPVLVIGSEGFIGKRVVAALAKAGLAVFGFDRREAEADGGPLAGAFVGSITDRDALRRAIGECRPETLISLAAWSDGAVGLAVSAEADPDAAFDVNVEGFRNMLGAALEGGVGRVVWSSSTVVLGPAGADRDGPVDEDAPPRPVNMYGLTKTLAEEISAYARRVSALDVAAVRPTLVFGPDHPYGGLLDPLKRLFAGGEDGGPVEVAWGSHAFDIVHVDDVAEAIRALACKPDGLAPVYHVNGGPITIREIGQTVLRRRPGTQIVIRDQEPAVVYPLVSSKRIEIETGFRPRFGARATIEDCIVNANTPKRREACLR